MGVWDNRVWALWVCGTTECGLYGCVGQQRMGFMGVWDNNREWALWVSIGFVEQYTLIIALIIPFENFLLMMRPHLYQSRLQILNFSKYL
jgi:hypothetical protein